MDLDHLVVRLCIQGTQAEYQGRPEEARRLYEEAWQAAQDDLQACIAAHYVARFQSTPREQLRWNQEALDRAERVKNDEIKSFYPSLYLNLGQAHERVGNTAEAQRYYQLAAQLGATHAQE